MSASNSGIPADLVQSLHEIHLGDSKEPISVLSGGEPFNAKGVATALLERREKRRAARNTKEDEMLQAELSSKKSYVGAECVPDEPQRLAALQRMNILNTPKSENFDRITSIKMLCVNLCTKIVLGLCSAIFQTRYAFITLIDKHRQWFKSAVGLDSKYVTFHHLHMFLYMVGLLLVMSLFVRTQLSKMRCLLSPTRIRTKYLRIILW